MNKVVLPLVSLLLSCALLAQNQQLVPDQNPNFAVSRDKYMKIADSVNSFQSTTSQNTHQAIDWREDKERAKKEREQFHRELRMERARWSGYNYRNNYYNQSSYYGRYYSPYGNYGNNRWSRPYRWW